jgi:hypothetical protein
MENSVRTLTILLIEDEEDHAFLINARSSAGLQE